MISAKVGLFRRLLVTIVTKCWKADRSGEVPERKHFGPEVPLESLTAEASPYDPDFI
jgi:hypothetical protein